MDLLQIEVENLIQAKIKQREAFTTADISHPLIAKDPSIRHRKVREIIDSLWRNSYFDNDFYITSPITVYPEPGKPQTVRLFHPDEPGYDVNQYTRTNQRLDRTKLPSAGADDSVLSPVRPSGFDMNSDGSAVINTAPSGNKVAAQCEVQQKERRLNIPRILVSQAGFKTGDKVKVASVNGSLRITRNAFGDQKVDAEGRIRVSSQALEGIGKTAGQSCNALLITDSLEPYIEVC